MTVDPQWLASVLAAAPPAPGPARAARLRIILGTPAAAAPAKAAAAITAHQIPGKEIIDD